jgi:hypothetical protein
LLRRGAAVASALLLPRGASALTVRSERDRAADALVATFTNRTSAAIVGRSYLDLRPAEADIGTLLRLIDADPETVRDKVHDDFVSGRVVALDGLVLSETELRLCALAALRS